LVFKFEGRNTLFLVNIKNTEMVANMKTLENLLERGVITLSGNNDNIFYVDRSKNIGKTTWGEIDSLKFIGYTQGN
jgi:hypothetical protein